MNLIFNYNLDKTINIYICITPIFSRNIIKNNFIIATGFSKKRLINVIIHELTHFYFYNKFTLNCDEEKKWLISEIIVEPIIEIYFNNYYINDESYAFDKNKINKIKQLILSSGLDNAIEEVVKWEL